MRNPFDNRDYADLSESEQAHVDAANDDLEQNDDICMCGKAVDVCPDAYSHMTQGY